MRWLAAGGLVLLACGHAANLLAEAYSRYAEGNLDQITRASIPAAARLAARLSPWSARRQGLSGWVLTERREWGAGIARYHAALRWGTGDPLLWAEYAQALARGGDFGPRQTAVTRRALDLAPASPVVMSALAAAGLTYWPHADEDLRQLWLVGIRYERDNNRAIFLNQLAVRGQAQMFCADVAERLGEQAWCADFRRKLAACRRDHGRTTDAVCVTAN